MLRHFDQLASSDAPIKNGKGTVKGIRLLNDGEFLGKGRLFNHMILKPGCSVGAHRHTGDMEVYYILSGEGLYDDNGTLVPIRAGDVAICPDGETHMLENTGTTDMEFIALILYA